MHKLKTRLLNLSPKKLNFVAFAVVFGVLGTVLLFKSFAEETYSINGKAFNDANRNGVLDSGEGVFANHSIYLLTADRQQLLDQTITDASGSYSFQNLASGSYSVEYNTGTWRTLQYDWYPTTASLTGTPRTEVALGGNQNINFGLYKIVKSTDANAPISEYSANGLKVQSYIDVITAQSIHAAVSKGLLASQGSNITVRYGLMNTSTTGTSSASTNGQYVSFTSISNVAYTACASYGVETCSTLAHEYGHAWSHYYNIIVQQKGNDWTEYLKARGLYGDSRVYSSYAWQPSEMIAEDYRQLLSHAASAQGNSQVNREIPFAKDVPGLKDWLQNTFTVPPAGSVLAPTNLVATPTDAPGTPAVQLSWTASSGATGYNIYRNTHTKLGTVSASSTSYFDASNLAYDTKYSYTVKAISATGQESPPSDSATVTTLSADTDPPVAPTLSMTSKSKTSISLTWTASEGASEYRLYRVGGRKQGDVELVSTQSHDFVVSGLKAGTNYTFYVIAVDAAGNESALSNTLTVKTLR